MNQQGAPLATLVDWTRKPIPAGRRVTQRRCSQARDLGTQTLLGRTVVRYACADSAIFGIQEVPGGVHEMSLDQSSRLLLRDTGPAHTVVATDIEIGPPVDAGTLSTERPAGSAARVEDDPEHPKVDDFRLPRVGGGEVALADFPPPLVIVAGDAAGIRTMVARLLPLTQAGARPRVIGLLTSIPAADWTGSLLTRRPMRSCVIGSPHWDDSAWSLLVPPAMTVEHGDSERSGLYNEWCASWSGRDRCAPGAGRSSTSRTVKNASADRSGGPTS